MNSKKSNWLFLTIILVHFAVVAFLLFMGSRIEFGIMINLLVSEGIIAVPAVLFLLFSKSRWGEVLGFHKIRISTFFMIVLFTFLVMPLITVLNAISMFFTENAVASMEQDIMGVAFPVMLFLIGMFGPFCEEFVFRGVIYGGYLKSGNKLRAILLSALLFGLMHMNVNQAIYAFVIGILLAFLMEATGSLWAPVFCHMIFNSEQVCLMYLSNKILGLLPETGIEAMQITQEELLAALSVYLVIAAITTPIALCVLAWIAKNENRETDVKQIWVKRGEAREYLVSVPLIIAIVLCLAYMSLEFIL
ncbi:MAG: CPBP family intramembrane metalloprotease [Lachnospiraceae bacterium]|nr:CPBP family intramembrane metalloprotease [Lachnospiraceae bacterium]